MAELGKPRESLCVFHLLHNQLGHYVPVVNLHGADGHDLLPLALRQLAYQHHDQSVQLGNLRGLGSLEWYGWVFG